MKRLIIFSAVFLCVLVAGSFVAMFCLNRIPDMKTEITGNIVDNELNNLAAGGKLARIGNKIYYNYTKGPLKYGLIEISKDGSKRIFWNGPIWLDYNYLLPRIRSYNGNLISTYNDNSISRFSFEDTCYVSYDELNEIPGIGLYICEKNGILYYIERYKVAFGFQYLSAYDGLCIERLLKDEVYSFSIKNNVVYSFGFHRDKDNNENKINAVVRKYDIDAKTAEVVYEIKDVYNVTRVFFEGDFVVFSGDVKDTYGIYKLNIIEPSDLILVRENSNFEVDGYNVYGGMLYMASKQGLLSYNLITGEEVRISNKKATECYIVDDRWIYFVGDKDVLWRVSNDGKNMEKVFG